MDVRIAANLQCVETVPVADWKPVTPVPETVEHARMFAETKPVDPLKTAVDAQETVAYARMYVEMKLAEQRKIVAAARETVARARMYVETKPADRLKTALDARETVEHARMYVEMKPAEQRKIAGAAPGTVAYALMSAETGPAERQKTAPNAPWTVETVAEIPSVTRPLKIAIIAVETAENVPWSAETAHVKTEKPVKTVPTTAPFVNPSVATFSATAMKPVRPAQGIANVQRNVGTESVTGQKTDARAPRTVETVQQYVETGTALWEPRLAWTALRTAGNAHQSAETGVVMRQKAVWTALPIVELVPLVEMELATRKRPARVVRTIAPFARPSVGTSSVMVTKPAPPVLAIVGNARSVETEPAPLEKRPARTARQIAALVPQCVVMRSVNKTRTVAIAPSTAVSAPPCAEMMFVN